MLLGVTYVQAQRLGQESIELPLTPTTKKYAPFLGFTISVPLRKVFNNNRLRSYNNAKRLITKFEAQEQINSDKSTISSSALSNTNFYKTRVIEHNNVIFNPNSLIRRDYIHQISQEGIPIYDSRLSQYSTDMWSTTLLSDKTPGLGLISDTLTLAYTSSNCNAWNCYYERMPFPEDGTAYGHNEQSDGNNYCRSVVWINGHTYVLQFADENWCPIEFPDPSDPPTGGGGGGGGGGPVPFTISNPRFIISSLSPCAQGVVNQLLNAPAPDNITNLIRSYASTYDIEIIFKWEDLNDPTLQGTARGTNAAANAWEIVLNSGTLANASREYIAQVLIHELLHIDLGGGNDDDHNDMAENYISIMSQALLHAGFVMSEYDRTALAWGGLGETTRWREMVQNDQANNTGITGAIVETDRQYRQGEKGQDCN